MTVDYNSIEAENWSRLRHARTSWQHYADAIKCPDKCTEPKMLGGAVHVSVLEPDEFPRRYMVLPSDDDPTLHRGKKEGKVLWAEYQSRHPDCGEMSAFEYKQAIFRERNPRVTTLTEKQYAACIAMRNSVRSHAIASEVLSMGTSEQTIEWTEHVPYLTGTVAVRCKGRVDWRKAARVFADLKTTRSVRLHHFAGQAESFGVFHQMAWYRRGIAAMEGCSREAVTALIVWVENVRPYSRGVREPDGDSMASCDIEIDALLAGLVRCRATNIWPGPNDEEIEPMRRPRYAMTEDDNFDDLIFGEESTNAREPAGSE